MEQLAILLGICFIATWFLHQRMLATRYAHRAKACQQQNVQLLTCSKSESRLILNPIERFGFYHRSFLSFQAGAMINIKATIFQLLF